MRTEPVVAAVLAGLFLAGCQTALPHMAPPAEVVTRNAAPPGAAPGTCWDQDDTPAVIETVTEQVVLQPAELREDGTVARPAVYKTETRQKIVKPRETTWFETPCEAQLTPEFNASLQRALKARGHYRGPINGQMDGRTRRAVRAYQKPQGLDSGMISLAAARQMGLVAVEVPQARKPAPEAAPDSTPEAGDKVDVARAATDGSALEEAEKARMAEEEAAHAARTEEKRKAEDDRRKAREEAERQEQEAARRRSQEEAERQAALAAEDARRADEARRAEAARKADAARQAEKARRAAELAAALEAEQDAKSAKAKPLPISTESYPDASGN